MPLSHIDPQFYKQQLDQKIEMMTRTFKPYNVPALNVFDSPDKHYRLRCEFRVWHDGDDLYHIMFDQKTKQKIRVEQYLPASTLINSLMLVMMEKLKDNEILRRKLFQIDYLSTLSGEILISLLYHKPLDEAWQLAIQQLSTELSKDYKIKFIGRARKQKFILTEDYVTETLTVNGKKLHYQQIENSFTQPNGVVNQKMLEWALNATQNSTGDLLELYCGNGNFSLALAPNFNRVLATEISKPSVASAQHNIAINQINNVDIIRMSSEEFTQAMNGEREFSRLNGIDLSSYDCNTILVDPPRAGLDDETVKLVSKYDTIIYISCSPETLELNLQQLEKTHTVEEFAVFDQFPYTPHIESGLILKRR
ncbi:tRNA (uridine(54)-C5)-methyltransferase TrmA [Flocculibacter collagenilyticus]|uniref:tRNA (uridine(54)-C5)-methyltransferase TrmA n=1 Tax=Flocculibacter collagenilyticus TaxID=2744479 RepID=UPI0018F5648F|nr:tRNA (uridine(54)-C5)-methyltransferase TrmA [Flocculibacter collagenilyticus]